jgi:hypothetical protein
MKRVLFAFILVVTFSLVAPAQQYTYYFPQVASGTFAAGSWTTTIFLSNAASPGTLASGTVTLNASDGSNWNLNFIDDIGRPVGSGNTIPFQLNSGEVRKYVSVANAPLNTGFATVTANAAVLGTALFTQFNPGGVMVGEAGVPAAIPLGRQAVFVDTTSGFRTGVAVANPNTNSLEVHYELVDTLGNIIMSQVQPMGPLAHVSIFVDQLFPSAPAMVGRLQFYCTNPMVGVALRFDPSGNLFTTLPPIAIAGLTDSTIDFPAIIRRERWTTA